MAEQSITVTCGGETATTTFTTPDAVLSLVVDTSTDPLVTATVTGYPAPTGTGVIDWGDGSDPQTVTVTNGRATATHTYRVDGSYTLRASATDAVPDTAQAVIHDANVLLIIEPDTSGDPTVSVLVVGYPPTANTGTIDWGDDTAIRVYDVVDGELHAAHTYSADGDYTVTAAFGDASSAVTFTIQRA